MCGSLHADAQAPAFFTFASIYQLPCALRDFAIEQISSAVHVLDIIPKSFGQNLETKANVHHRPTISLVLSYKVMHH